MNLNGNLTLEDGGQIINFDCPDGAIPTAKLADAISRKYAGLIGDGAETDIVVTHNLGTRDVVVAVYDASDYTELLPNSVVRTTTDTITVSFLVAPATDELRVVVIG